MDVTPELFRQQSHPRFGTANPERMHMAFWEWMIRGGEDVSAIRREPKFTGFGPWDARNAFDAVASREKGPIWTFDRFGATRTILRDGRVIYIGGEHEDYYDPDFCIYNDLVVLTPSNQVEIYGYPAGIFPPTDFHSATLLQNRLFVIGALGYKDARRPGETLVHTVDLSGYEISTVQTSGDKPGWIYEHKSTFDGGSVITLRGGRVIEEHGGEQVYRRNFDEYSLDVNSGVWRRETDRKWHQFKVRQSDGKLFILERHPSIEEILPEGTELLGEFTLDPKFTQIEIDGVPMSISVGLSSVEIIVQADLPHKMLLEIVEQIRAATELSVGKPCILKSS